MQTRTSLTLALAVVISLILARAAFASPGLSALSREAIDYLKTRGILPLWIGATRPIPPWDFHAALEVAASKADTNSLSAPDLETLQWLTADAEGAVDAAGAPGGSTDSAMTAPFGVPRSDSMLLKYAPSGGVALGWAVDSYAAELTAKTSDVAFRVGRLTLGWGPAPSGGGLLFGESAGPFDALQLSFTWHRVQFTKVVGWFDAGRSIVGTRMDMLYRPNLRLGFSENVLMVGPPYLLYAINPIPIALNKVLDRYLRESQGIDDDFFLGFDWDWVPRPGLRLFGELLIKDITVATPTSNFPPRWGLTVGYHSVSDQGAGLQVMYTIVPNWTYSSSNPALNYLLRGLPVAHVLGNDFDVIDVRWTRAHPPATSLWAAYIRKGEGMVGQIWTDQNEANQYWFLRGVVEYSVLVGIDAPYGGGPVAGTIGPYLAYRWNAAHVPGVTRLDWGISLSGTTTY